MAGYKHPREIIAVILPQCATTCSTSPLDKRYILKDDEIEMEMGINHLPRSKKDHLRANCIYRKLKKPSSRDSINGLYIFQLSEDSSIFTKSGVYQFIFSVVSILTFFILNEHGIIFFFTYCQVLKCRGAKIQVSLRMKQR
jgi:hypothetical protein